MATHLPNDVVIQRIKASLVKNPRLHDLICAALMEMAAEKITKEAIETDRDTL